MKKLRITPPHEGFTLAEVLITLGIIGVVAAITMPVLMANYRNKVLVTQLQKVYSELSQAVEMINNNFGEICDYMSYDEFFNQLTSKIQTTKICKMSSGCFESTPVTYLRGGKAANWNSLELSKFVMTNGAFVMLEYGKGTDDPNFNLTEPVKFPITVDINGLKGPNQFGYDVFIFAIRKGEVIPLGKDDDSALCDKKVNQYGYTCAFKVLKEGKINY